MQSGATVLGNRVSVCTSFASMKGHMWKKSRNHTSQSRVSDGSGAYIKIQRASWVRLSSTYSD